MASGLGLYPDHDTAVFGLFLTWRRFVCSVECTTHLVVEYAMSDVAGVEVLEADAGQHGEDVGLMVALAGV